MTTTAEAKQSPFDSAYLSALKAGDTATENHFAAHFNSLLNLKLRCRLRNPDLSADIRQETLRRVLQAVRVNDLRSPEKLPGFVLAVCNNVILEQRRKTARLTELDEWTDPPDHRVDPEKAVSNAQTASALRAAIVRMTPRDREVLHLVFYENVDRSEVSDRMGVSQAYVRVLLHRAMCRLRKELLHSRSAIACAA